MSGALELVKAGKYADAIPLLEKIVENSPESATAWCNLGVCYLKEERMDDAVNALRKGVDLASGKPEAYEFLGSACLAAGKLDDAKDALMTANTISPGNPRILTALGAAELKAGKIKPAFAHTMEALDRDSAYAPALYNMAVIYRDSLKNNALAAKFFRRFLAAAPSDPRASEARGFLDPQASAQESPAKALVEKAKRHMNEEDYDMALVALREALKKDPGYADAVWNMAILADNILGDSKEAFRSYEDFRKKFPNDKRSQQARQRAGELKAQLANSQTAPSEEPKQAEIQADPGMVSKAGDALAAGAAWQAKGDSAKAEAFFRRAIELDGSMAAAFYDLGVLYYRARNLDGAKAALEAAVELDKDYSNARYMLANAQYSLGDRISAAENLSMVLQQQPDFARAHYLLGTILAEEKELEASKVHFDLYAQLTGGKGL